MTWWKALLRTLPALLVVAASSVLLAAMHGNETGPSRILYDLREGRPIKGADIWVVPSYNRDGVVRRTRQNAHGVDLNRNYPRNWKRLTGAYYSGPKVASEPETQAVMAFLTAVARPTSSASTSRSGASGAPVPRGRPSCGGCTAG